MGPRPMQARRGHACTCMALKITSATPDLPVRGTGLCMGESEAQKPNVHVWKWSTNTSDTVRYPRTAGTSQIYLIEAHNRVQRSHRGPKPTRMHRGNACARGALELTLQKQWKMSENPRMSRNPPTHLLEQNPGGEARGPVA